MRTDRCGCDAAVSDITGIMPVINDGLADSLCYRQHAIQNPRYLLIY